MPTAANADSVLLIHEGKPVPAAKLTVISPDKWSKIVTTDAQGRAALPLKDKGRYIVTTSQEETGDLTLGSAKVAKIYHITTLTFVRH